ncbi:MAG: RNA polymerase sporulation sigma factor SigH [Clostridia bacterium]|nr:RNA polymerase sporulation sigma factor SigH [Clostridia bacterium]
MEQQAHREHHIHAHHLPEGFHGERIADDETLVERAQHGDLEAVELLYSRYRSLVKNKARSYFLVGADREDIVQEGMIGLHKAIRDYRPDKQAAFHTFAEICIVRQIITAIKTATRQKHIPLNSYVSLNRPVYDEDSDRTLMDMLSGVTTAGPEELLIGQEDYDSIEKTIEEMLSPLERETLSLFLEGKSYHEIAEEMGRHPKSVDNALQRIKRKMEKCLNMGGEAK